MFPRRHTPKLLTMAAMLVVSSAGCAAKIGDDCSSSTDCSINGDRLCDTTQPGGYCTVFNCEPDTCPEEAQCIAFDQLLDPACPDPQQWPRFERTFCMRRCDNDGDCRSGYICFDMAQQPNPWGSTVVDLDPEGTKVCVTPASGTPMGGAPDVCYSYDGGFPDVTEIPPDDAGLDGDDGAADAGEDAIEEGGVEDAIDDTGQDAPEDVVDDAPGDVTQEASDADPND